MSTFSDKMRGALMEFILEKLRISGDFHCSSLYYNYLGGEKISFTIGSENNAETVALRAALESYLSPLPDIEPYQARGSLYKAITIKFPPEDFYQFLKKIDSVKGGHLAEKIQSEAEGLRKKELETHSIAVHVNKKYVDIHYDNQKTAETMFKNLLEKKDTFPPALKSALEDHDRTFLRANASQPGKYYIRIPVVMENDGAAVYAIKDKQIGKWLDIYKDILDDMEGSWLSNPTLEKKDLESIQIILDRMWWDKFLHQGNLDKDKRSLDFGGTDIPRLRTSEAHEGEKAAAGNANLHVFSKKNADQGRA